MLEKPYSVRKFAMKPEFEKIIKIGKKIKIEDRFFPYSSQDVNEYTSICRVDGMIPLHCDRPCDQSYAGAFYPFHEGMIWNFILWTEGNPALLLGQQRPKVIPLQPGMAIWFDITETFHAVTQISEKHPKQKPEFVFVQVSGHPKFLFKGALRELKETA